VAAQERTAVLVIRAWIEGKELRARIEHTCDVEAARAVATAAASAEEVVRVVEQWLRSLAGPP
jgi:hypothetical protein